MHLFVAVFANGAWIKFVDLIFCNTNVFFFSVQIAVKDAVKTL